MEECEMKQYKCIECNFLTNVKCNYQRHLNTKKHLKKVNKYHEEKYVCKPCNFVTTQKYNYERHCNSHKHNAIITSNDNKPNLVIIENDIINQNNYCIYCGKCYQHRSSLSKHIKKCKEINQQNHTNNEQIIDLLHKVVDKPTTNNYTNNTNNTFNLNVFLNNECKDAVTLIEFVNSIQLKLKDLEETAQNGFVDTMTSIMVASLEELDITKRPIHSTDGKRGVMYIKDNHGWEKDENNRKITNAINIVNNYNMKQISEWIKENPGATQPGNSKNGILLKMLEQTVHDDDEPEHQRNVEKVIKKVAKSVVIDK